MIEIPAYLKDRRAEVEAALALVLPAEGAEPSDLTSAMRYSTLAGGKRLRPILTLAAVDVCSSAASGSSSSPLLPPRAELVAAACALELIHTYSLIHDDLPCMDDDSLRRGRPTCHVVYGEAIALLAGDTLQTLGFEVLSTRPAGEALAGRRAEAVAVVALAIGRQGMAGGQAMDLAATGLPRSGALDEDLLLRIHARKTGRLIAASLEIGAVYAGVEAARREAIRRYGAELGLLFQIADDLLDVTGSAGTLGKTAGKDATQEKLTYPVVFGLEGARRRLEEALERAIEAARSAGDRDELLSGLARYAAYRDR